MCIRDSDRRGRARLQLPCRSADGRDDPRRRGENPLHAYGRYGADLDGRRAPPQHLRRDRTDGRLTRRRQKRRGGNDPAPFLLGLRCGVRQGLPPPRLPPDIASLSEQAAGPRMTTVSYTHLDVYKRQASHEAARRARRFAGSREGGRSANRFVFPGESRGPELYSTNVGVRHSGPRPSPGNTISTLDYYLFVIPDLIRDPLFQRCVNGSRIKSGMTKGEYPLRRATTARIEWQISIQLSFRHVRPTLTP